MTYSTMPEPSQTPSSQDNGTSSGGSPMGSSIMARPVFRTDRRGERASALTPEQVVEDHNRDGADRQGRQHEQTRIEEFEGDQRGHESILAHGRRYGRQHGR